MPPKIEFLIIITQLLNASIVCFYWRAHAWEIFAMNGTMTKYPKFHYILCRLYFVGLYFDRLYFAIIHVLITKIHD